MWESFLGQLHPSVYLNLGKGGVFKGRIQMARRLSVVFLLRDKVFDNMVDLSGRMNRDGDRLQTYVTSFFIIRRRLVARVDYLWESHIIFWFSNRLYPPITNCGRQIPKLPKLVFIRSEVVLFDDISGINIVMCDIL